MSKIKGQLKLSVEQLKLEVEQVYELKEKVKHRAWNRGWSGLPVLPIWVWRATVSVVGAEFVSSEESSHPTFPIMPHPTLPDYAESNFPDYAEHRSSR